MSASHERVWVEAHARLHFGVLDLAGSRGRRFGGIGAPAPVPPLLVSASAAPSGVVCEGNDAARGTAFAQRFLTYHGVTAGARLQVHRSLPSHAGLGSGTQLALSIARALAEVYDLDTSVESLATSVGRTRRSGVGMWVFAGGGFVLEGGRGANTPVAPLLARIAFPEEWRCVVAVSEGGTMSGAAEESAFDQLPAPPAGEAERVAHHVLMALLPALVEADLTAFGCALAEIQQITGQWFAPAQGGTFSAASRELIEELRHLGAHGVGQSSWGPTVYGIVSGDDQAGAVVEGLRAQVGPDVTLFAGPFPTGGTRVWREPSAAAE
ncbi:MAG: beta-ribofuranosylaminobenzene 5'-phosphate synthase family protein [Vicinamibacterales bacterium]